MPTSSVTYAARRPLTVQCYGDGSDSRLRVRRRLLLHPRHLRTIEVEGDREDQRRGPDVRRIEPERLVVPDCVADQPDHEPRDGHETSSRTRPPANASADCSTMRGEGTTSTGQRASCTTAEETLPCSTRPTAPQPCAPTTIICAARASASRQ